MLIRCYFNHALILTVLPQVQPFNFTVLDAFDDRDLGVLIVRDNGSTVSFSVDVVADPCPSVNWTFNGMELGASNDTFTFNDPCTEMGGTSPIWTFTLDVALTAATSGRYDANFTNIAGMIRMPEAYFSVPSGKPPLHTSLLSLTTCTSCSIVSDTVTISSLSLVSQRCLVEGMNISLRCQIDGVPRPTIEFRLGEGRDEVVTPGQGIYENYIVQDFYDQV